jgi:GH24 family phage-related lysozyme (muramidase)
VHPKFEEGVKLAIPKLKASEGWRGDAYKDQANVVTIGWGFTAAVIPGLKMGDKITREKSDQMLETVVRSKYATPLANAIKVWNDPGFTPLMFSALVNMIYNIGPSMLRHEIIKKINLKDYNAAAKLITQKDYTTAGGVVNKGLIKRRLEEAAIFKSGMMVKVAAGSAVFFLLIGGGIATYWWLKRREIAAVQVVRAEKKRARAATAELQPV